ncbi:MAG: bifunctional glutamate N-acetyltransferase/amino-acid acetyltransferase ArgJ [Candidatus Omnitrophota bacterium]
MKVCKEVVLPLGFKASGIYCGIKKAKKLDLALLYSTIPAKAAGLFTVNKIPAAPVVFSKNLLRKRKYFRGILINSGNANSFTGKKGFLDAQSIAVSTARSLGLKKDDILVSSTGIIGKALPVGKIKSALPLLVKSLSEKGISDASRAIMTTDTFSKKTTVRFKIEEKVFTICGIAKGAGMIAPNMATLLVFILTDALLPQSLLKKSLQGAVEGSFNSITIDGCMSTNDTVLILANGASGKLSASPGNLRIFQEALNTLCLNLAKMIVKDAEGATKFIEIKVSKAKSYSQAKRTALSIANSNLFKTALYGENPNFGRIVSAVGASGIDVAEDRLKIKVSSLKKKYITVSVSLGKGESNITVYTSDLTPKYIKINAEYN